MSAFPQQQSASGKPPSPPPAYSEHPEPSPHHLPVGQAVAGSSQSPSSSPLSFPAHAVYYGPTPIAQQAQLLPYYDPRSPHAIAEATHRARWRFITAALWAIVIMTIVSFIAGVEVEAMMAQYAGA